MTLMERYINSVLITGSKIKSEKYLNLGIMEEFGEVAGKIKKYMRGDYGKDQLKDSVKKEIGDLTWYLVLSQYKNGTLNHDFSKPKEKSNIYSNLQSLELLKGQLLKAKDKRHKGLILKTMINRTTDLAWNFGINMEEVVNSNIRKTLDRFSRGTIRGSGDER